MADVRPFRGLRYNTEKTKDLSPVITPPYDVISAEQQSRYYDRNPCNLIRLELGKKSDGDTTENNRYTRAAETLDEWIREQVLNRDEKPAYYLVEHCFPFHGGTRSYWGLIAAVRLEDFDTGTIRATEITMAAPIQDRLQLLRACQTNFSPIMGAFIQQEGDLLTLVPDLNLNRPDMSGTDDVGVVFNLWVIDDEHRVDDLTRFFADKRIYIADGHHRYTTSLNYRQEIQAAEIDKDHPCNFVMMTLISSNDRGLTMLPTHRLVRDLKEDQLFTLKDDLARYFNIEELAPSVGDTADILENWMDSLAKSGIGTMAFCIYGLQEGKCFLLTPHDANALYDKLPADHPLVWRKLDVSVLHGIVLKEILGIDTSEKEKACLEYSPDEELVINKVQSGDAQLAVLLNPAPIYSIMAVADAGDRMPQKSTYFYPKTVAGLVMNPLY